MKPILVSGIKPTGRLHIGNYFGVLKNFVDLQNSEKYDCYFFIADLHSLTINFDVKEKEFQIKNLMLDYISAGLDEKKSTMFIQSLIPAHSEIMWILDTITPIGELERMTQFKDKKKSHPENINAGLLNYPVLMAGDILLYDAKIVPVGEDQLQHLEITRTIARKFNKKFGNLFIEPKGVLTRTSRVMDLKNPNKKMSKSSPEGCIFLDDSPEEIKRKIMGATTDSGSEIEYDIIKKPGISNLLDIYSELTGKTIEKLCDDFSGSKYSDFKNKLADDLIENLLEIRKKKEKLSKNNEKILNIFKNGSKKANKIAEKKILDVRKKIGLISI